MDNNQFKTTVIIVEDELIQSLYLKKILESLGFNVIDTSTEGRDSIKKVLALKPDFITMDIQLSDDVDGIDATHEIQKQLPIPVLYITGNTDLMHSKRIKQTHYIEVLPKPVSKAELKAALDKSRFVEKIVA